MSKLFTSFTMRGLEIPNRIVVSPMCQYIADDGAANDWHMVHMGTLSMSGAGLFIIEATHVSRQGRITPGCLGLYSDENEAALNRAMQFARAQGTAKLGIQIAHAGRKASCHVPNKGGRPLGADENPWETVGPSAAPYAPDWHVPRAFAADDFGRVKDEFVQATRRADRIGFDLAELHGGHGYLLHQFLSPLSNLREDGYGGDIHGRMRYPLEVFEAVRDVWPEDKPMGVRLSAIDWVEGGLTIEETIEVAKALKAHGCDFVDITTAGVDHRQRIEVGPGYQVPLAERVRNAADIPTMAVGMINQPQQAEGIIASGQADFVMLARGFMYNPRWAWHAAEELGVDIPYPAQYARAAPAKWPRAFPGRRESAPKAIVDPRQI